MTPQKLSRYLGDNTQLKSISAQAQQIAALQQSFLVFAPAELARSSRVHCMKGATLVIRVEHGAAAAKLRQLSPRLLALFRNVGHEVTGIRVEVQATDGLDPNLMEKKAKLSKTGATAVARLAAVLEPSSLRSALERLAARTPATSDPFERQDP